MFSAGVGAERIYFPEKTIQVADRPAITLVVLAPDQSLQDEKATRPCLRIEGLGGPKCRRCLLSILELFLLSS